MSRPNELTTEQALTMWRSGQTQAERLCAGLLLLEGYQSIDPQCPLGGPDGLKDVICERDDKKYVAACFFPNTRSTSCQLKKKYLRDFAGVEKHSADGFLFFTNQRVTPAQRTQLEQLAGAKIAVIYHLERIIPLLDSPRGYGFRAEFLRIHMNESEQYAFLDEWKDQLRSAMANQGRSLTQLMSRLDGYIEERLRSILDIRSDITFLFAAMVHVAHLMEESTPGAISLADFIARNRQSFALIEESYRQYLMSDSQPDTHVRQRQLDLLSSWKHLLDAGATIFSESASPAASILRRALDDLTKSVDPKCSDAKEMLAEGLKRLVLQASMGQSRVTQKAMLLMSIMDHADSLIKGIGDAELKKLVQS